MNGPWLPRATLLVASLLAPSDQRTGWLEEWRSELWYIPPRRATLFCMGAFRDAFWLRRNNLDKVKRTRIHLQSPLSCLALLATLAALSVFVVHNLLLPRLEPGTLSEVRDLPGLSSVMLLFSCLLLPGTLRVWRAPANRQALPWPSRMRRGIFLVLKIALLQPIMLCGLIVAILMGRSGGLLALAWDAAFIFALRWVITDQHKRCPVCLGLLMNPVRIGTPSQTFLDWYGTESTCPHGHGLLHVSEMSSGYAAKPQWLGLGNSWNGLFTGR
jgi:hypothetical protein